MYASLTVIVVENHAAGHSVLMWEKGNEKDNIIVPINPDLPESSLLLRNNS